MTHSNESTIRRITGLYETSIQGIARLYRFRSEGGVNTRSEALRVLDILQPRQSDDRRTTATLVARAAKALAALPALDARDRAALRAEDDS